MITDEQRKRIHTITYSTQDRMELAERIVKLEDEGLKLRVRLCELYEDADQMEAKEKQAVGENAELRELCGDLFDRLMDKDEHCGECRSQCEHDAWNFGDSKCVYAKRMRELGI